MPRILFKVSDEDGKPIRARGRLHIQNAGEPEKVVDSTSSSAGLLAFMIPDGWSPRLLRFAPIHPGYWPCVVTAPSGGSQLGCERLPSAPPSSTGWWWHELLNPVTPNPKAGHGIRIGVIDTAFSPMADLEHVHFMSLDGKRLHAGREPIPNHGEVVCRLIGQRTASQNRREGIAPGAGIILASAGTSAGKLDLNHVVLAVLQLARDHEVDLINISAGLFDNPLAGLRSVIRQAERFGTLCVVAAGNEPSSKTAFPARYPDCIGVGAIGLVGWGSEFSAVRRFGSRSSEPGDTGSVDGHPIFHFPLSAFGEGLDVVAPGVGILINRGETSLFAASGTSYAAPMVCGLLAAVLSEDASYLGMPRGPQRTERARAVLFGLCVKTGLAAKFEGSGLPRFRTTMAPLTH